MPVLVGRCPVTEGVSALIRAGADVTATTANGETALDFMTGRTDQKIVELFEQYQDRQQQ